MAAVEPNAETMSATSAPGAARSAAVAAWLLVVCALVVTIIVIGGLTRLTDSGLSITEWKPVTGALPPLGDAAWAEEFAKYQQSPEYQRQNIGMTLGEFKFIFWWEWGHRLLGRIIGLAFAAPLLLFWLRGALPGRLKPRLVVILALIGFQGFIGWWMVASGLVDRVDVSQHRLAAHLMTAFLILAVTWWTALDALQGPAGPPVAKATLLPTAAGMAALVAFQIALGAYVAGLDGGRSYTGWPLIDGALVPAGYGALEPFWRNLWDNPLAVQINHRFVGYAVVAAGVALWVIGGRGASPARLALLRGLAALCAFQAALGIVTLVNASPLLLSSAHQLGAVAVFLTALTLTRQTTRATS